MSKKGKNESKDNIQNSNDKTQEDKLRLQITLKITLADVILLAMYCTHEIDSFSSVMTLS